MGQDSCSFPYNVVYEGKGRLRLRPLNRYFAVSSADEIYDFLGELSKQIVVQVAVHTKSILFTFESSHTKHALLEKFCLQQGITSNNASKKMCKRVVLTSLKTVAKNPRVGVQGNVNGHVVNPLPAKLCSFFLPRAVNGFIAIVRSIPYIVKGVKELFAGRLGLDVLDAAALVVCILRRDFKALASITFFFKLGEFLAEWTRKKSHSDLIKSLSLNIQSVWVKADEAEYEIPLASVKVGDIIIVRAGAVIPVDGSVYAGEALVNQASMTGEPLPVHRSEGATVYAGTVVVEGEIEILATKLGGESRINSIINYIEKSEAAKAGIQSRYEKIADGIVVYNFLLAGLVFLLTRDPIRAGAVLLVDYSCAIRISTPLCVFSAMQEAIQHGALVKGGRFLEAIAQADAIVFDKTGTLTQAKPRVIEVIPFAGYERKYILRIAACLEEHFPHPVGQAVVRAAEEENLHHREEHSKVEFIVAHGVASSLAGQRVLIGSRHFVHDDEKISITEEQERIIDKQSALGRSVLYLAIENSLAGVLAIEDVMREQVPDLIKSLYADGIKRIIMLTGDGEKTAKALAAQAGIAEYHAQLLPENKAVIIKQLQEEGYKVAMVGDGINDAPALSTANVGIAMTSGADMAKEIADVVLVSENPMNLLLVRKLGRRALRRIQGNFYKSVVWNSTFLAGALFGVLSPGVSALLHNVSTAVISVQSMQPLLKVQELEKVEKNNDN